MSRKWIYLQSFALALGMAWGCDSSNFEKEVKTRRDNVKVEYCNPFSKYYAEKSLCDKIKGSIENAQDAQKMDKKIDALLFERYDYYKSEERRWNNEIEAAEQRRREKLNLEIRAGEQRKREEEMRRNQQRLQEAAAEQRKREEEVKRNLQKSPASQGVAIPEPPPPAVPPVGQYPIWGSVPLVPPQQTEAKGYVLEQYHTKNSTPERTKVKNISQYVSLNDILVPKVVSLVRKREVCEEYVCNNNGTRNPMPKSGPCPEPSKQECSKHGPEDLIALRYKGNESDFSCSTEKKKGLEQDKFYTKGCVRVGVASGDILSNFKVKEASP